MGWNDGRAVSRACGGFRLMCILFPRFVATTCIIRLSSAVTIGGYICG